MDVYMVCRSRAVAARAPVISIAILRFLGYKKAKFEYTIDSHLIGAFLKMVVGNKIERYFCQSPTRSVTLSKPSERIGGISLSRNMHLRFIVLS